MPAISPETIGRLVNLLDYFAPPAARQNAEVRRRAHLFLSFSFLGFIFGTIFAGFYLAIGHPWGAFIVFACVFALAGAPWIVRAHGLERAGNVYALVLVLGFAGLTAIEGGLHGHAVAWLAVVPLCACMLVGQQACYVWCGICLAVMGVFCLLELAGVAMPILYPPHWESTVTVAGYLALAMFMSLIGIFFESGRRRALDKLHDALTALSQANEQLNHLNQERSAFLSIAAHDLRNPLGTMLGFAQLMQRLEPGETKMRDDSIKRILNAGAQMRGLLDRLLGAQAIEEGKLTLNLINCDLAALAAKTVENHQITATAKKIFLGFTAPATPAWVVADPQAVTQIIDNLLSNAIKFSPPGRPVGVSVIVGERGEKVSVEVQDAGPGLSVEDQQKLYGRFAKLSARPTGGESSSGLGLSIVKRLAESMNGQLECRSQLGEGSTFVLALPPVVTEPGGASKGVNRPSPQTVGTELQQTA